MKKRIVAITLCLSMISAFTVTTAVSATGTQNGESDTYQYDVVWKKTSTTVVPIGKLTVNLASGHWAISANAAKTDAKETSKEMYPTGLTQLLYLRNSAAGSNYYVCLGTVQFAGGCPHGQGTAAPETLAWLAQWGPGAEPRFNPQSTV